MREDVTVRLTPIDAAKCTLTVCGPTQFLRNASDGLRIPADFPAALHVRLALYEPVRTTVS
jgi:hypothetical protein